MFNSRILLTETSPLSPEDFDSTASKLYALLAYKLVAWSGFGLASTQVGSPNRAFVILVRNIPVFIANPEICTLSKEVHEMQEGCLSMGPFRYKRLRPKWVVIRYLDENGEKQLLDTREYPIVRGQDVHLRYVAAQCIVHEMEHLDGTLYSSFSGTQKDRMLAKVRKYIKLIHAENGRKFLQPAAQRTNAFTAQAAMFLGTQFNWSSKDLQSLRTKNDSKLHREPEATEETVNDPP